MKKKTVGLGSFVICIAIALTTLCTFTVALAAEPYDELAEFRNITYEIFGIAEIDDCEYLYGMDGSPDFVYADFKDNGYVIYNRESMEMLEYSSVGDGPYCGLRERKYYAGPYNYFIKDGSVFVNLSEDEYSSVSENQARALARQVNESLSSDGEFSGSEPVIDQENLIPATPPGTASAGYIDNAQYFITNPTYGYNKHGTCGSVAAQILLGYNNYYNDRRIIAPEHLNGGWDNANGNNDLFDDGNYISASQNPYVCDNPTTMTRPLIGSNDNYYNYIIGKIEPTAFECVDTVIKYTFDEARTVTTITVTREYQDGSSELISTESRPYEADDKNLKPDTKHTHNGTYMSDVADGLDDILKARIPEDEFDIRYAEKFSGSISSAPIKAEIDAGRPLIIQMQERLGGVNHWVVGYGYQDYAYPQGHPSAGETYSGYVVHCGWWEDENNIWINEAWCSGYISLELMHEHDLNVDTERNIGNDKREVRCGECGFRTLDELYTFNSEGDTITGCKYDLAGQVTIPLRINGTVITAIGESAFENRSDITSINLPIALTDIGSKAFASCNQLTSIYIPRAVNHISEQAFMGCDNLNIKVAPDNDRYSAQDNILYDKAKTQIIDTGKINSCIAIPDTVTEISPHAFANNVNLVSVRFSGTPKIGEYAFCNCLELNSVYFDSYDVPSVGEKGFSGNNFVLYTRYNAQDAYRDIFEVYTDKIVSLTINVAFIVNDQVWDTKTVYNGSTVVELPNPKIKGYIFNGWYDNESYIGEPFRDGQLWESETNIYLYVKLVPKKTTVTLDSNGGTMDGTTIFEVTYGQPFSMPITVSKTGNTLDGWYCDGKLYMTAWGQSMDVWDREEENVTLTASWSIEKYEIQINDNGSIVWLGVSGISDTSCSIAYGTVLSAINLVPIYKASKHGFKEGKIFDHFEYDNSMLDWTSIPDLGDNGDIVIIIPKWIDEEHTIYFSTHCESDVDEIKAKFGEAIVLPIISRTGYIFDGWYTSISYDTQITWVRMPDLTSEDQNNGSTQLHAKWLGVRYFVSYKSNGGTGTMTPSTHIYGEEKELTPNAFSKRGHDFIGWSMSASGSVKYDNKQSVINLSDHEGGEVVLYAIWKPRTYNIIYNNLMPDMVVSPKTYTYGVGLATMPTPNRKSGYNYTPIDNFYGWYTNVAFTTRVYSISSTDMGDVYLYAKYDYLLSNTYASYTSTVTDGNIDTQPHFYVDINGSFYYNDVMKTTLRKIKIEFSMDIWEVDDGYQDFYLYRDDSIVWEYTMEHGPKKDTSVRNYTFTITLDFYNYRDVDWFDLKFGAHGKSDDTWKFNNFKMSIYFIN